MPDALQQRCQHIVTSPVLTGNKRHFSGALKQRTIVSISLCQRHQPQLDEDHLRIRSATRLQTALRAADYAKFLANGSEMAGAGRGEDR